MSLNQITIETNDGQLIYPTQGLNQITIETENPLPVVYDLVDLFKYAKNSWYWSEFDGIEPHDSFTQSNLIAKTNGGGRIDILVGTAVATKEALYSISDPFTVNGFDTTVTVQFTSSGLINGDVLYFRFKKNGETTNDVDISISGVYNLSYNFANATNDNIEIGIYGSSSDIITNTWIQFHTIEFHQNGVRQWKSRNGIMIGKSDDELGLINTSTQDTFYNFYEVDRKNYKVGIRPNEYGDSTKKITVPNHSDFDFGTDDFILEADITVFNDNISAGGRIFMKRQGLSTPLVSLYINITNGFVSIGFELRDQPNPNGSGIRLFNITPLNFSNVSSYDLHIVATKVTSDPNNFTLNIYKDSVLVNGIVAYNTLVSGFSNGDMTTTNDILFFSDEPTLTADTSPYILKRFKITINGTVREEWVFNQREGLTVTGTVNGHIATTTTTAGRELIGGGLWVESDSIMPEIKQGLKFNTTKINKITIPNFNPIKTDGYTFLFEVYPTEEVLGSGGVKYLFANQSVSQGNQSILEVSSNYRVDNIFDSIEQHIILTNTNFNHQGFKNTKHIAIFSIKDGVGVQSMINGLFINQSNVTGIVNLEPDDLTYLFASFNHTYTRHACNGLLIRFGMWDRALTREEMLEISQPSKNPSINNQKGLQVYYQFQEGSFYEDTGQFYIRNIAQPSSVQGGDPTIWDAEILGYDNLDDIRFNVINTDTFIKNVSDAVTFQVVGNANFDPVVTILDGGTVVWYLGDGTITTSNSFTYNYPTSYTYDVKMVYPYLENINAFDMSNDSIKGELDVRKLTRVTNFNVSNNAQLTSIKNPSHDFLMTDYNIENCGIEGTLDMRGFSRLANDFECFGNSKLTKILFPNSTETFDRVYGYNCNLIGELDMSMLTNLSGLIIFSDNPNLISVLLPTTSQSIDTFNFSNCNLSVLDLSVLSNLNTVLSVNGNSNLTSLILPSNSNNFSNVNAYDCDLGYIDFTVLPNIEGATFTNIQLHNNNMTTAEVDHILVDFNSILGSVTGSRIIKIDGTNAAPSDGTVSGFDGLAAKASLQGKGWTVTTN